MSLEGYDYAIEIKASIDNFVANMERAGRVATVETARISKEMQRVGKSFDRNEASIFPLNRQLLTLERRIQGTILATELKVASDERMSKVLAELQRQYGALVDSMDPATIAQKEAARAAQENADKLDVLQSKYDPLYAATKKQVAALEDYNFLLDNGAITATEYAAKLAALDAEYQALERSVSGVAAAEAEALKARQAAERAAQDEARTLDALQAKYDPLYAAEQKRVSAIAELNRLQDAMRIGSVAYANALEQINRQYDEAAASTSAFSMLAKEQEKAEQAAKEHGRELQGLLAKYDAGYAAQLRYAQGINDLTRLRQADMISIGQYEAMVERLTADLRGEAAAAEAAADAHSRAGRQTAQVAQNVGYQFADLAVQIQSGQSALVAFTQQGSQMVSAFGAWGAAAGAALAIGGALLQYYMATDVEAKKAQEAIDEYKKSLEALEEQQKRTADAEYSLANAFADAALRAFEVNVARALDKLNSANATLEKYREYYASLPSADQTMLTAPDDGPEYDMARKAAEEYSKALAQLIDKRQANRAEAEANFKSEQMSFALEKELMEQRMKGALTAEEYAAQTRALGKAISEHLPLQGKAHKGYIDLYTAQEQAKTALSEYEKAQKEAEKGADGLRSSVEEVMAKLQDETAAVSGNNKERFIEQKLLALSAAARTDYAKKLRESATLTAAEEAAARKYAAAVYDQNKALADHNKAEREAAKVKKEKKVAFDEYIAQLEREAKMLYTSDRARVIEKEMLQAKAAAARDYAEKLRETVDLLPEEARRVEELAGVVYDTAQAFKKSQEEAKKWGNLLSGVASGISSDMSGAFKEILLTGRIEFEKFGDYLKKLFADIAAKIAEMLIFQPIVNGVANSLTGSVIGSAAGASIGGTLGGFGTMAALGSMALSGKTGALFSTLGAGALIGGSIMDFGLSSTLAGGVGLGGVQSSIASYIGETLGATAGQAVADAMAAGPFGALALGIGQLTGLLPTSTGASIGGTLGGFGGGALGSALFTGSAFAGPVGAVVGAIAGALLGDSIGGFFGGKKAAEAPYLSGGISYDPKEGYYRIGAGGNVGQAASDDAYKAMLAVLGAFNEFNANMGLAIDWSKSFGFDFNLYGATEANLQSELFSQIGRFVRDGIYANVAPALKEATDAADGAEGIRDAIMAWAASVKIFNASLEDMANQTRDVQSEFRSMIDAFNAKMDDMAKQAAYLGANEALVERARANQLNLLRQEVNLSLRQQVLQYDNPQQLALEQWAEWADALLADVSAIGGDSTLAQRLIDLKRAEIDAQYGLVQATQEVTEAMRGQAADLASASVVNLTEYTRSLMVGDLSALTQAQQLQAAERTFNAVSGAAMAGDYTSISALPDVASAYLGELRGVYGSSAQYAAGFDRVVSSLEGVASVSAEQLISNTITLETRTQTQTLVDELRALRAEVFELRNAQATPSRLAG